ncbi:hypothetical protein Y032_0084g1757 [Ancylostoma ceylanicum]|uniref:Uncharacterized protein n=1 Tax=Ancylostoma ceylanicum TaxID=53326 RepID=A0A016TRQ3_9BILA|nr:hypothetical protein Y032_0084g1757 [Ancylostoma ceylanicum]
MNSFAALFHQFCSHLSVQHLRLFINIVGAIQVGGLTTSGVFIVKFSPSMQNYNRNVEIQIVYGSRERLCGSCKKEIWKPGPSNLASEYPQTSRALEEWEEYLSSVSFLPLDGGKDKE